MLRYQQIKQDVEKRQQQELLKQDLSILSNMTTFRSYDENDIEHRRSWNINHTKCKQYSFDIESQLPIKTRNVSTCDLPRFSSNQQDVSEFATNLVEQAANTIDALLQT